MTRCFIMGKNATEQPIKETHFLFSIVHARYFVKSQLQIIWFNILWFLPNIFFIIVLMTPTLVMSTNYHLKVKKVYTYTFSNLITWPMTSEWSCVLWGSCLCGIPLLSLELRTRPWQVVSGSCNGAISPIQWRQQICNCAPAVTHSCQAHVST